MSRIMEGFTLAPENRPIGDVDLGEATKAINKLAPEFMSRIHDPVLGCCMGGLLGDCLWAIHKDKSPLPVKTEKISMIRSYYQRVLGDEFKPFWSGFVAEFAGATCIDQIGYPVYKPTLTEDTRNGVDFWIDLESPNDDGVRYVAVQVKTMVTECDPRDHIVFPVNSDRSNSDDLIFHWGCTEDRAREIERSSQRLKDYVRGFDNAMGVLMILPSPGSEYSLFNEQTGALSPIFPEILYQEIDQKIISK